MSRVGFERCDGMDLMWWDGMDVESMVSFAVTIFFQAPRDFYLHFLEGPTLEGFQESSSATVPNLRA